MLYVPPSMPAVDLLVRMQATRTHIALVIDEYGGTDGLVSMEDLVEIVVGEIEDEHDQDEAPSIAADGDGVFTADARATLDELKEATGIDLSDLEVAEDIDTIGGLVVTLAGRVPSQGETVEGPERLAFDILDADPRRIKRVRISQRPRTRRRRRGAGGTGLMRLSRRRRRRHPRLGLAAQRLIALARRRERRAGAAAARPLAADRAADDAGGLADRRGGRAKARGRRFRAAAAAGWWWGFGFFVAGLWWLGAAFLVEADKFAWAMPLGVVALPALLAVFPALAFGLARLAWPAGRAAHPGAGRSR